ncbi:metalloproteinase inhibitor 3-like isoform X1 [Magallana gigas]|uniref:Metalloproteinase inhibitor 3 n=2 Tax=Magallana gigas TaxID=29159 RepID=Q6DMR2_MAGGI|nr:metalloproteinase inhibitor 3-like precursor [Crassostrea gigas]AAT73610.1 tissue inhibitor of metalloproteinase TIMP 1.1 [Crassostrea gigas]|eukprot:NP_001292268.1 metalloproteinase inhibitor 3-like precursor [Crassostrea gigas]
MQQYNFNLFVVLTVLCVRSAHSCMCDITHPQNKFCSADFVIKATIVREDLEFANNADDIPFPLMKNYTVQYKNTDIYKGSSLLGSSDTLVIKTSGTPWNCGETFTLNKEYVISGFVSDGEFFTNHCQWNPEYLSLKPHQRRGLRHMYGQGCGCTVHYCRGDACDGDFPKSLNPNQACIWPGSYNTNDCYAKYGFCLPDVVGVCNWKQNRMLRGCLKKEGGVLP